MQRIYRSDKLPDVYSNMFFFFFFNLWAITVSANGICPIMFFLKLLRYQDLGQGPVLWSQHYSTRCCLPPHSTLWHTEAHFSLLHPLYVDLISFECTSGDRILTKLPLWLYGNQKFNQRKSFGNFSPFQTGVSASLWPGWCLYQLKCVHMSVIKMAAV